MKKTLFFAAAAIAMLASCSQNDLEAPVVAQSQQGDAIEFGTYLGKAATSRAGATGSIKDAQALAQHEGFGVFAYYTGTNDYLGTTSVAYPTAVALTSPQASAMAPNFMYNQQVTGTNVATPEWSYTPVKYWPNGNTTADDQDNNAGDSPAVGEGGGKISFFAYAPYVTKAAANGTGTGIISMSDNSATGNPTITYKMQAGTANPVDLLWGTAGTNGYKAQDGTEANSGNYIAVDPTGTTKWADRPFAVNANLTKMKVQGKVQFAFKHALAKVGGSNVTTTPATTNGLQVVLDVDNGTAETGGTYDNSTTKVTVSDITITARAKVDTNDDNNPDKYLTEAGNKGTIDLATGQWTIDVATAANITDDKASASSVTHQITTSGSSPANASLNSTIAEPTTTLADGTAAWDGLVEGVLTTAKNVYQNEANPLVYIPGTYPELDVQITYITRTKDANLAKEYSEVLQTVKKTLTFNEAVKLNKQYNLIIRLGLTGVKFDATVSDWEPDTNGDGNVDEDDLHTINLPINVSD